MKITQSEGIFSICSRNDMTVDELAEKSGVRYERIALALEARTVLSSYEWGQVARTGMELKRKRLSGAGGPPACG